MIDPEKITGIFRNLDEYVGHLQALSQTPREEFLADYADAFRSLGEAGIVPVDFVASLQQMAGLRNRLVHRYWLVDDDVLYQLISAELGDFDRFKACVLAQLPEEQQGS